MANCGVQGQQHRAWATCKVKWLFPNYRAVSSLSPCPTIPPCCTAPPPSPTCSSCLSSSRCRILQASAGAHELRRLSSHFQIDSKEHTACSLLPSFLPSHERSDTPINTIPAQINSYALRLPAQPPSANLLSCFNPLCTVPPPPPAADEGP